MKYDEIFTKEDNRFNHADERLTSEDLEHPFHLRAIQNFNNLTPKATKELVDVLEDLGWLDEYKIIVDKINSLIIYNLVEVLEGEEEVETF